MNYFSLSLCGEEGGINKICAKGWRLVGDYAYFGYDKMTQYQNSVVPTNGLYADAAVSLLESVKSVSFYFSDTDLRG